ncbi:FecR family protein [Sphingomonas colocasiae]|uniref:FecR domain-containing protein n=1 Tax=Sphingomonas colocasiae TaxID=1848973 RepID=A0ABS7PTD8_9SPHN|nr:FecR domain-containing protein [Sphingomonas colocasiae]MBY8823244.1 FecR domain-containing protein [Sphingomonas colocasiae]
MNDLPQSQHSGDIDAEAAAWLIRLSEAADADDATSAWLTWYEADPEHRRAFDAMVELWDVSGGLEGIGAAHRDAPTASDTGTVVRLRARRRFLPLPSWALGGIAASLVLASVSGVILWRGAVPLSETQVAGRIQTETGKVRQAMLADGSEIELGGRSAVAVRYSQDRRLVVAENGEAFFRVAKNPDRPFVVDAGPLQITAIGTAFSVQREGSSVSVVVSEGVVEVRAQGEAGGAGAGPAMFRIAAGERATYDRGRLTRSVETRVADLVTPWHDGRLEFRDEPLRLVVARINRYSRTRIEIGDRSIEELRVTSTVYDDRIPDWLEGIAQVLPVKVERRGADTVALVPATAAARPLP